MRARVEQGDRDPAVLGAIAAEIGMAGAPADELAEIAEGALAGVEASSTTAAGWSWYNGVRSLVWPSATTSRATRSTSRWSVTASAARCSTSAAC